MTLTWTASATSTGVLLAANGLSHQVVVCDLGNDAPPVPFTTGAAMDYLSDMVLGPDGHLYVLDGNHLSGTNQVLQFNERTGAFMDVFAQSGPEGWDGSLAFGPDGHLYWFGSGNTVRKYDGATGHLVGDALSLIFYRARLLP